MDSRLLCIAGAAIFAPLLFVAVVGQGTWMEIAKIFRPRKVSIEEQWLGMLG